VLCLWWRREFLNSCMYTFVCDLSI
jgi:hypothetical protein